MNALPGIRTARTLFKSLAGAPKGTPLSLLRSRLLGRIGTRWNRLKRRLRSGHVGLIYRLAGPAAGTRFFWMSPSTIKTWPAAEPRLDWLASRSPQAVPAFVEQALRKGRDPMILLGLSQNPHSSDLLQPWLEAMDETGTAHPVLLANMRRDQCYAAAYVGAVMRLLGPEAAARADAAARQLFYLPRDNYTRYLDSIGLRPAEIDGKRSFESVLHRPAQHRLIVLENTKSQRQFRHLLSGAEAITVIDISDLYGKMDLSDLSEEMGVSRLTVEHARTRLTRFSTAYHRLHADTAAAAEKVMERCMADLEDGHSLFAATRAHLTLDIADQFFFEGLKVRALRTLLDDTCFDQIVLAATTASPGGYFWQLLSCLHGLNADPRIEVTALAPERNTRLAFRACVEAVANPSEKPLPKRSGPDIGEIEADMLRKTSARAAMMGGFKSEAGRRILFLVNQNSAYDASTISFIETLQNDFEVRTAFLGSSLGTLLRNTPGARDTIPQTLPVSLSQALLPDLSDLSRWLQHRILHASESIEVDDIARLARAFAGRIIRNSVLANGANAAVFKDWMARLLSEGTGPDLILLCPQRSAKLGALADVSHELGIPSLALEPHGLNGNYCRYSKVRTDYYAVISDYFRKTAESDFGIPEERCTVIGSPRIRTPEGYDKAVAKASARADLTREQGIDFTDGAFCSFFCQPSEWDHVAKVWHLTLQASEGLGLTMLLKTHPEESPARIALYMEIAQACGAADRVIHVRGGPDPVIDASDVVLTGYSAAAIDAAVRHTPVFCVTADNEPYPVDQHDIVHTELCGDVASLRAALTRTLNDPTAARASRSAFLNSEPQFAEGYQDRLVALVEDILATPREEALRRADTRPASAFLDGPFRPFSV